MKYCVHFFQSDFLEVVSSLICIIRKFKPDDITNDVNLIVLTGKIIENNNHNRNNQKSQPKLNDFWDRMLVTVHENLSDKF
jgi:hypothetical protein